MAPPRTLIPFEPSPTDETPGSVCKERITSTSPIMAGNFLMAFILNKVTPNDGD